MDRKFEMVAILREADKTPVVEASPAISLIQELVIDDVDVTVYDPLAMESVQTIFGDEVTYANSIEECVRNSPVCVLMLLSKAYKEALENYKPDRPIIVIDAWRQLDEAKLDANVSAVGVGRHSGLASHASSGDRGLKWAAR